MPVIVGSPRSGTTLLRLMLDAHPQLAIPPETGFLALGAGLADGAGDALENFCGNIMRHPPDAPNWPDFHLSADTLRAELGALDPFDVGAALRAFYRMYAARFGKSRWGEKTPPLATQPAEQAQLVTRMSDQQQRAPCGIRYGLH